MKRFEIASGAAAFSMRQLHALGSTIEQGYRQRRARKRLWEAADQFRANSGLKSQEYSAPVLGLIFLRFAEVRFLAAKQRDAGADTSAWERELNELVSALHGLTPEEIKLVEGATANKRQ